MGQLTVGSNPTPSAMDTSTATPTTSPRWRSPSWRPRPRSCTATCPSAPSSCTSGVVIAQRHNERERRQDPTAHAEVLALQDAARHAGTWRLDDCTLVVTLEPCVMCAGALLSARIGRLVYGAADLKAGATASLYNVCADPRLNHNPPVTHGVLAEPARRCSTPSSASGGRTSVSARKDARADEWDGLESR